MLSDFDHRCCGSETLPEKLSSWAARPARLLDLRSHTLRPEILERSNHSTALAPGRAKTPTLEA